MIRSQFSLLFIMINVKGNGELKHKHVISMFLELKSLSHNKINCPLKHSDVLQLK